MMIQKGAEPENGSRMAAKRADAAVRRALVESHQQLLGFLRRRLGSTEEAEEVLQAFMLRALERSAELRDVRTVRGWLSRILATTLVDHQRRSARRRQREVVMSPDDLDALSIEPDVELDEAVCNCLYKLLPTIKPEYAEVIWRVDLLSEPRDRVAASLGVSLNNVTVRLHRGPAGAEEAAGGDVRDVPRTWLPRLPLRGGLARPPSSRGGCCCSEPVMRETLPRPYPQTPGSRSAPGLCCAEPAVVQQCRSSGAIKEIRDEIRHNVPDGESVRSQWKFLLRSRRAKRGRGGPAVGGPRRASC